MDRETAGTLATDILVWIAAEPDRIGRFLTVTGSDPATIRRDVARPDFHAAILDFLLSDEALLLECVAALGLPAEAPRHARRALPGGAETPWT